MDGVSHCTVTNDRFRINHSGVMSCADNGDGDWSEISYRAVSLMINLIY